jgi:hypothetical protein
MRAGYVTPLMALAQLRRITVVDDAGMAWMFLPVNGALLLHRVGEDGVPHLSSPSLFVDIPMPSYAVWRSMRPRFKGRTGVGVKALVVFAAFSVLVIALMLGPAHKSQGMAAIHGDLRPCAHPAADC